LAVAVEVPHGHGFRSNANTEYDRLLKGAISEAQQYRDIEGVSTSNGQVQFAVAVEVRCQHRNRIFASGECERRAERPVADASQHGNVAGVSSTGSRIA